MRLDVGCGSRPTGDVNCDLFKCGFNPQTSDQAKGDYMNARSIPNFVVVCAEWLPFRSDCFEVVYSSHVIEHVNNPFQMFKEMVRVSKRKVVVRCPHRRGGGAKRPYHKHYFDEDWFRNATEKLGLSSKQFVASFDFPITERIRVLKRIEKSLFYRIVRRVERSFQRRGYIKTPFEVECWVQKYPNHAEVGLVIFVIVYTDLRWFSRNPYQKYNLPAFPAFNSDGEGLSSIFNRAVKGWLDFDVWFAFCHQDFYVKESLEEKLKGKNTNAVYGCVGARLNSNKLFGEITQTDGTLLGVRLLEDAPVQTLDEMCLIVHSKLFRQGLRFDERFRFHFYGADLCMQAHELGFDVLATQVNCEHRSKTVTGNVTSKEYLSSLELFKRKWKDRLPIKTTTKLVEMNK